MEEKERERVRKRRRERSEVREIRRREREKTVEDTSSPQGSGICDFSFSIEGFCPPR